MALYVFGYLARVSGPACCTLVSIWLCMCARSGQGVWSAVTAHGVGCVMRLYRVYDIIGDDL